VLRGTIVIASGVLAFACYTLILGVFEIMLGIELRSVRTAYESGFVSRLDSGAGSHCCWQSQTDILMPQKHPIVVVHVSRQVATHGVGQTLS